MKFYIEAEIPPSCYLHEAAWMFAFGVPPKFYADEDANRGNPIDVRDGTYATETGEVRVLDHLYTESMFAAADIKLDYKRYLRSFAETGGLTHQDVIENRKLLTSGPNLVEVDGKIYSKNDEGGLVEFETTLTLAAAKEARWRSKYDSNLNSLYDFACAKIFALFCAGELSFRGWRELSTDELTILPQDHPAHDTEGMYISINSTDLRLNQINWTESECEDGQGKIEFKGILLDTRELISHFSEPLISGSQVNLVDFGAAAIAFENDGATSPAPRLGRRKKADGILEKFLLVEFRRRQIAGVLPEKKEAVYAEAEAWAKADLREDVSRSSIQRFLAPLWREAPKSSAQKDG